jgi:hypothetical protein
MTAKLIRFKGAVYRKASTVPWSEKIPNRDPWRHMDQDIKQGLAAFFSNRSQPALSSFDVTKTYMSLPQIKRYIGELFQWVEPDSNELATAREEEILTWASNFRPHSRRDRYFVDVVKDILAKGFPALVIIDSKKEKGLMDGWGRYELARALGMKTLPVLLLTDVEK